MLLHSVILMYDKKFAAIATGSRNKGMQKINFHSKIRRKIKSDIFYQQLWLLIFVSEEDHVS